MAVTTEREGAVAIVTMRRPEAFNAFNSEQLEAMLAVIGELSHDRSIRALVLTGEGRRAFASGADIKEISEKGASEYSFFTHAVDQIHCSGLMPASLMCITNLSPG